MNTTPETNAAPKKVTYDAAKIDAAIKLAKEQAADKPKVTKEPKTPKAEKPAKEPKTPKVKEPKPAKEPKAEKPAKEAKPPAHLNKVERASEDLPALSPSATTFMEQIAKGVSDGIITVGDLITLSTHLAFRARLAMTASAVTAKLTVGSTVRILPGDKGTAKYVGMLGVLTAVRTIRCFADIQDENGKVVKKGLYLFTSGVQVVEAEPVKADPPNPDVEIPHDALANDEAIAEPDQGLTDADAQASDAAEAEAVQAEGNGEIAVEPAPTPASEG